MRLFDLISPVPQIDAEELARCSSMSRVGYALRSAGWAVRCAGIVGVLSRLGRVIWEPAFRPRAVSWKFILEGGVLLGFVGLVTFLITAYVLWPSMRRMAVGDRAAPEPMR